MAQSDYPPALVKLAHELAAARLNPFFDHVATVCILRIDQPLDNAVLASGTISLLETPQRRMLVTNSHVYDAYRKARAKDANVRLALFGNGGTFGQDISDLPVLGDGGEMYDLLSLAAPDESVTQRIEKAFWRSDWPPIRARDTDIAIAFGFPTEHRRYTDDSKLTNRRRKIGNRVTAVGGNQFLVADYEDTREYFAGPDGAIETQELCHGGMSGCAVFLFDEHYLNGRLGGFLHSAQTGADAQLLIHHADLIAADGRICIQ